VACKEEDSRESCGGWLESNTWGRQEAGGGARLQRRRAAVKRGSGRRQVRRGEGRGGQRGVGEGGDGAGKGTWTQSGAGAAGAAHMAGQCGGISARRETEEEGER
jgi:hypothetical protein